MKYIAILDTDDFEDFEFFEDGKEKYLHAVDANAENGEWIYLPFKALEQEPTSKNCRLCKNFGSHHGICEICKDNKCWTEIEPTADNDSAVDCISRQAVLEQAYAYGNGLEPDGYCVNVEDIQALPSVTPQEPRKGEWLRMSDLSEEEDYRYKCSRCGNVIHYKNKMDLYTFNSWCGRCGSDNGIHIDYEVEECQD